jgi:putative peptide zinc metalloprotease protein
LSITDATDPTRELDRIVPRLRAGTELLGLYEGSGFTTPQYLVRRDDGQVIRISQLLNLVTAQIDGSNDLGTIAARVSEQLDRTVTAEHVAHLIDTKLDQLLGIVEGSTVSPPSAADPLLGLRLRAGLVPERVHRGVTNALRPLFLPVVVASVLVTLTALDAWIAVRHRSTLLDGWIEILTRPGLFLAFTAVTVAVMAFHEFGHAAACRYSGGRPGVMGVGVYIVWPAFFTDVSDAYRLDRRGRLRTDLGGIYFNAIFAVAAIVAFITSGFAPLLVVAAIIQAQALYQLVPFVRLDGYYILGDLIGVPNPFSYVKATLVSLFVPRRSPARRNAMAALHGIRRSARITLTVWVALAVPMLLAALVLMVYLLPRTVPAILSTLRLDARLVAAGVREGDVIGAANGTVQFVFMLLPLLGWLSTLWYIGKPLARKVRTTERRVIRPALVLATSLVAIGALAVTLHVRGTDRSDRTDVVAAAATVPLPVDMLIPPVSFDAPATAPAAPIDASGPATAAAVAAASVAAPQPTAPARPTPTRWTLDIGFDELDALAQHATGDRTTIGTWHVQRGDDFWRIAEQVLTDTYRRAPTPAEHGAYWSELVEANRDRLVHPDDPSTIFRGQELEVILPALAADQVSLFDDAPLAAPAPAHPAPIGGGP